MRPADVRMEQDEEDQRVLEEIVAECRKELAPEQRREAPCHEQGRSTLPLRSLAGADAGPGTHRCRHAHSKDGVFWPNRNRAATDKRAAQRAYAALSPAPSVQMAARNRTSSLAAHPVRAHPSWLHHENCRHAQSDGGRRRNHEKRDPHGVTFLFSCVGHLWFGLPDNAVPRRPFRLRSMLRYHCTYDGSWLRIRKCLPLRGYSPCRSRRLLTRLLPWTRIAARRPDPAGTRAVAGRSFECGIALPQTKSGMRRTHLDRQRDARWLEIS